MIIRPYVFSIICVISISPQRLLRSGKRLRKCHMKRGYQR